MPSIYKSFILGSHLLIPRFVMQISIESFELLQSNFTDPYIYQETSIRPVLSIFVMLMCKVKLIDVL